jgi:hypothetical protein
LAIPFNAQLWKKLFETSKRKAAIYLRQFELGYQIIRKGTGLRKDPVGDIPVALGNVGLEAGSEVSAHFQGSHCCCLHLARDNLKKNI